MSAQHIRQTQSCRVMLFPVLRCVADNYSVVSYVCVSLETGADCRALSTCYTILSYIHSVATVQIEVTRMIYLPGRSTSNVADRQVALGC